MKSKTIISCVLFCIVSIARANTLTINEERRLDAQIAANVMNRIAMVNDRIVNVFGEEDLFMIQTDEHTGQIFIKPTPNNGTKPLAITLITEKGITQDLNLIPSSERGTTVILKSASNKTEKLSGEVGAKFHREPQNFQEQLIQVMKQAVLGELPVMSQYSPGFKRKLEHVQIKFKAGYQAGGSLVVEVWQVKNISREPQSLQEKQFFKLGDLAISLSTNSLMPNETTLLYVLGRQS